MSASLKYGGVLKGHRGWITALACPLNSDSNIKLVSASRDNTLVVWKECVRHSADEVSAIPTKRLEGHSDFVSDVALSNTGDFAISSSWDKSLRLWNLAEGNFITKFLGHSNDVLAVAFSPDNRQIVSVGRDNKLRIWNVKGDCIITVEKEMHTEWISCVRFSPSPASQLVVTGSWDNTVKVWSASENFALKHTLVGHTGHVNSVTVSPDGSLCASAGKDGKVILWDLSRGEFLYELDCKTSVNQICFSPNRYWLCAAIAEKICVFDLETKKQIANCTPELDANRKSAPECTCICWSNDGSTLYSGYTDNTIHLWEVLEN